MKGNKNALKPVEKRASSWVQLRVTQSEKSAWQLAAKNKNKSLSGWAKDILNHYSSDEFLLCENISLAIEKKYFEE